MLVSTTNKMGWAVSPLTRWPVESVEPVEPVGPLSLLTR